MDQKYLVSFEYGAGSLSNTEIGKKTLDMRISSEYLYNPVSKNNGYYQKGKTEVKQKPK